MTNRQKQLLHANTVIVMVLAFLIGGLWWWRARAQPEDARILYLAEDEQGVVQVFAATLTATAVTPLTDHATGVLEAVPAAGGSAIAYLVAGDDAAAGEETIWVMAGNGRRAREIVNCRDATCRNLTWAGDNRLIYERRELRTTAGKLPAAPPRLWWVDVETGETVPVLQDEHISGTYARVSPDGEWLAFVLPGAAALQLYNFITEQHYQIASETGAPVAWHPASDRFVMSDLGIVDWQAGEDEHTDEAHVHYSTGNHLFLVQAATGARTQLSVDTIVDDAAAAWSPDGAWLAFGRRPARTALGRQIWLMRAADGTTRPLTEDAGVHHGALSWGPNGRFLLYQRYDATTPDPVPGIWIVDVDTGEQREIVAEGFLPAWLDQRK